MSKVNKRKKKEKRKRKYKGIVMRPFCDPPRCPIGVREGRASVRAWTSEVTWAYLLTDCAAECAGSAALDPRQPALVWVALPVPRCCGSAHEPDIHTLRVRGTYTRTVHCAAGGMYARVGGRRRVGWRGCRVSTDDLALALVSSPCQSYRRPRTPRAVQGPRSAVCKQQLS